MSSPIEYSNRLLAASQQPDTDDLIARYALEIMSRILLLEIGVDPTQGTLRDRLEQCDHQCLELAFQNAKIALQNDVFRILGSNAGLPGKVMATPSVQNSPDWVAILHALKTFDHFQVENDPYHQHDFGAFEVGGTMYFFKIDYYDLKMEYGVDPLKEEPFRVMTIMRADEY